MNVAKKLLRRPPVLLHSTLSKFGIKNLTWPITQSNSFEQFSGQLATGVLSWIRKVLKKICSSSLCFTITGIAKIMFNKNAFQSKAHLLLANSKSNTYNLTLQWSWDDHDLAYKLLSRYQNNEFLLYDLYLMTVVLTLGLERQYLPPYQNWSFYVNSFKSYCQNRETHRHTNITKTLPRPHTGDIKIIKVKIQFELSNLKMGIIKEKHLQLLSHGTTKCNATSAFKSLNVTNVCTYNTFLK